jgi:hypothetical protein
MTDEPSEGEGARTGDFTPVPAVAPLPAYRPVTREDMDEHNPAVLHRLLRFVAEDTRITRDLLASDISPRLGQIERGQHELRGDMGRLEIGQAKLTIAVGDLSDRVRRLEGTDQSLLVRVSNLETTTNGLVQRLGADVVEAAVVAVPPTPTRQYAKPVSIRATPVRLYVTLAVLVSGGLLAAVATLLR